MKLNQEFEKARKLIKEKEKNEKKQLAIEQKYRRSSNLSACIFNYADKSYILANEYRKIYQRCFNLKEKSQSHSNHIKSDKDAIAHLRKIDLAFADISSQCSNFRYCSDERERIALDSCINCLSFAMRFSMNYLLKIDDR